MSGPDGAQIWRLPQPSRLLCLALWWTWIWLMFFPGNAYVMADVGVLGWWTAALLGASLAGVAALLFSRVRDLAASPGPAMAVNILCAVFTVLLFLLQGSNAVLAICLAFLACFLSTFWGARAIGRVATSDVRTFVAQIACALFLGSILYLLISDRAVYVETFLVTLLPLVALILDIPIGKGIVGEAGDIPAADCGTSGSSPGCEHAEPSAMPSSDVHGLPPKLGVQRRQLAIALFACAATFGVFGGLVTDSGVTRTDQTMMMGIAIVSLLVWALAVAKPQTMNRFALYYSTIPSYVLGMVFLIAAIVYAHELETASVLFVIIGWACSLMFGWSFFVVDEEGAVDERGPVACILLIQLGTLCGTVLMVIGSTLGLSESHRLAIPMIIIILLVFILIATVFSLFRTLSRGDVIVLDSLGAGAGIDVEQSPTVAPDGPMPSATPATVPVTTAPASPGVSDVAARMAQEHGLSERESEILEPLLRGYSLPRIADELGVAKSTVATHAQHIYKKVGVHSRQELIELLDESQR